MPATSVSYSFHDGKHFFGSAVSVLFIKLIYHGAGMVLHLLILKFSMVKPIDIYKNRLHMGNSLRTCHCMQAMVLYAEAY